MREKTTVFISSTSRDLLEYREKVFQAVNAIDGFQCVRMEDFGARDGARWSAEEFCRHKVNECDVLIGILGLNYGSVADGTDRSFTEMEYYAAVDAGKSRLMFLAPDNFPVRGDLIESDTQRARQQAFRTAVSTEQRVIRDTFNSPDDLARRVVTAISNLLSEIATKANAVASDTLRFPQVFEAAIAWRTRFDIARDQLDTLASFKGVHDQLHKLQFECYDMIVNEVRRFPDETANLELYQLTLQEIADRLHEVASTSPALSSELPWISELQTLPAMLLEALDARDKDKLKTLTAALSHLLSIRPSRINTALNQSAKALKLGDLVDAMRALSARCKIHRLKAGDIAELDTGAIALAQLADRLTACTTQHDQWQELENVVRLVEGAISNSTAMLTDSWPRLSRIGEALLAGNSKFADAARNLERELAAEPRADGKVRRTFSAYRRAIGGAFDKVDRDLKQLCDNMVRIGESLPRRWEN